jgi:hypothetical protein
MERRMSSGLMGDLTAGKKKGSAISELIKYWASSSQTPPGSAPSSPGGAAQNKTSAPEPARSPASPSASSSSDQLSTNFSKTSPALLSPKIAAAASAKNSDAEVVKASAASPDLTSVEQSVSVVNGPSTTAEAILTPASAGTEISSSPVDSVKNNPVPASGDDAKPVELPIIEKPTVESQAVMAPESNQAPEPIQEVESTPTEKKDLEKPIVEPLCVLISGFLSISPT